MKKDTAYYYMKTIAELKSVSKAAEHLYISQPALTKAITRLESELGVKLFDRTRHPVQLTYAGEIYLERMQNVLAMQSQLQTELNEIANMKKERLNVGIPNTRSRRWLAAILPVFMRDYPEVDLHITEGTTAVLEQELLDGKIDIAVCISLPMMSPYLSYEPICREQMMLLFSPKHPVFKNIDTSEVIKHKNALHYLSPERLNGQPYISAEPTQGLFRFATQLFERYSVEPKKVLSIANTSTARDLSVQGLGFSVLPTSDARSQRLQSRQYICCSIVDPPAERTMIVAYKQNAPLSSIARHFIDITGFMAKTEALTPVAYPLLHDLED